MHRPRTEIQSRAAPAPRTLGFIGPMKLLSLFKPEYCYRPGQILRRLNLPNGASEFAQVRLPWGVPLRVRPQELIGQAILRLGVFELLVTESVWRLTDPGETVADVGANIGYMTSVMARRVGRAGTVWAFEPHPEVFKELDHNSHQWTGGANGAIKTVNAAVSESAGELSLKVPDAFSGNRGLSTLEGGAEEGYTIVTIPGVTLDETLAGVERIGFVKMDVEGHELSVLRGASNLLAGRRVRDWVFEDAAGHPSPVTRLLSDAGYTLFRLKKHFSRPSLLPPDAPETHGAHEAPESPNFLATADPDRARQRFAAGGWQALRG